MTARRPWPKAILFDLDDTLWPIEPAIAQAEQRLYAWLEEHAPAVARRHTIESLRAARMALLEREPHFHLNLAELRRAGLTAAFAEAGEDHAKVELAMAEFIAGRNAVVPYDDVAQGLDRLRGRLLVGTISNGTADLEAIGLSHHFKVSVAAHQLGCLKPDAAIFHAACRELGVDPADAVYVGNDVLLDVQGAQRAGMRAVWLNRTGSRAHLEHEVVPDAIVADFDELLDWLQREHD
ncbi:HAD family hydrolase [Pseudoduganella sp. GCM10020061]|uniref:HAD family hydrolase n=1 Tax=Pseudoduganella sp. GCM10020061 TaxID=3317345 RepID=UPI00362FE926